MAKRHSTKPALIPAVAYLRKSTKGRRADGRQRQENSIENQRLEITQLAAKHGYTIARWYTDEGKSGWKMGAKRPGFQQLIEDAERLRDVQAVIVDDLDRFSRAAVMQTFGVYSRLAENGVKAIHSANDGAFPLDDKDIGTTITLVVKTHGSNSFSRKLGNRIAETRRNRAKESARRTGGYAPLGFKNDGKGGLAHGPAKELKLVRWIFGEFVTKSRSLWSIANELNANATPTRRGKKWSAQTIKDLLGNEAYRGDFVYNRKKSGDFWIVNDALEVVEAEHRTSPAWRPTEAGVIRAKGIYRPIIDAKLFAAAQRKLAGLKHRTRRPRANAYVLTGVLKCDHCSGPMFGRTVVKRHNGRSYEHQEYRCQSYERHGKAACGYHTVREELILPFVLQTLSGELERLAADINSLGATWGRYGSPPRFHIHVSNLPGPDEYASGGDKAANLQAQADELAKRIQLGCQNILGCTSSDLRQMLDAQVSAMIEERKALLAAIEAASVDGPGNANPTAEELASLKKLIARVPYQNGFVECPRASIREALLSLGAEVRLRWDAAEKPLKNGRTATYHTLARGRIRLGQIDRKLPFQLCQNPAAESCNGIRGADRSESHRDMGSTRR